MHSLLCACMHGAYEYNPRACMDLPASFRSPFEMRNEGMQCRSFTTIIPVFNDRGGEYAKEWGNSIIQFQKPTLPSTITDYDTWFMVLIINNINSFFSFRHRHIQSTNIHVPTKVKFTLDRRGGGCTTNLKWSITKHKGNKHSHLA